jgi:hypothetical protein
VRFHQKLDHAGLILGIKFIIILDFRLF